MQHSAIVSEVKSNGETGEEVPASADYLEKQARQFAYDLARMEGRIGRFRREILQVFRKVLYYSKGIYLVCQLTYMHVHLSLLIVALPVRLGR